MSKTSARFRTLLLGVVSVLALSPAIVRGDERIQRSELGISGDLAEERVRFYAWEVQSDRVEIQIDLERTRLLATLNRSTLSADVRSVWATDNQTKALEPGDLAALSALRPMVGRASAAEDSLSRLLNLLADFPAGESLDLHIRARLDGPLRTIRSICAIEGRTATGTYTVDDERRQKNRRVGPCYFKPAQGDACLGRCGPGCGAPPNPTIQIFAQDCFNHDLCTGETGTILGECADEWRAASDDFLFGRDCGDFDGEWRDNFNYRYVLQQTEVSRLSGRIEGAGSEAHCDPWSVSGSHSGKQVKITARDLFQEPRCCTSFTLTGNATSCTRVAGSWTNVCGRQGTFTLTRRSGQNEISIEGDLGGGQESPGADPR